MKPKIEPGKEYPTRGGGKAVVHFIDSDKLIGRIKSPDNTRWLAVEWQGDGNFFAEEESRYDILLSRIVMVPVEVPEWAKSVRVSDYGQPAFSCDPADSVWLSIEDWIASLEEKSDE